MSSGLSVSNTKGIPIKADFRDQFGAPQEACKKRNFRTKSMTVGQFTKNHRERKKHFQLISFKMSKNRLKLSKSSVVQISAFLHENRYLSNDNRLLPHVVKCSQRSTFRPCSWCCEWITLCFICYLMTPFVTALFWSFQTVKGRVI